VAGSIVGQNTFISEKNIFFTLINFYPAFPVTYGVEPHRRHCLTPATGQVAVLATF